MSQRVEQFIAVAFVVVLVATAWLTTSYRGRDAVEPKPTAQREAPDFTLPLLSGPDFVLSEQRGKTVIVDFWATWCGPCEVQMPVLDALWKHRYPDRDDLVIVGVSVDTDPPATVEAWVKERGFDYPIALGNQDLSMRYGVIGFPTLFVIDPDGAIHTQHMGVLARPELEDILDEIRQQHRPAG